MDVNFWYCSHAKTIHRGREIYTIINKYLQSLVVNQVFKTVDRSYFLDRAWQIIPDVASVRPAKRKLVGISSSKWYW